MTKNNNNELEKRNQAFLIYQDENGIARVNVRFEGEDVWDLVDKEVVDNIDNIDETAIRLMNDLENI